VTPPIGLIDHLPDAEADNLYPTRCVVIAGDKTNFTATCSGLPAGMTFDAGKGWVGNTPTESGVFIVRVSVSASNSPVLTKKYPLIVAPTGVVLPPHSSVDTSASPLNGGTTTGDGVYTNGTKATVIATPNAGYGFLNWTQNGIVVSSSARYTFTNILNQSLVANFVTNAALVFEPIPPQTADVLSDLWVTNSVSDPQFPANTFAFRLEAGAPEGADISTNDGVFYWCPQRSQAGSSNLITVVATSNGQPPRSATNSFVVLVRDYLELSLGRAVVQTGQTISVPIDITASAGVTNVTACSGRRVPG
jgi:hypothetical protein